jgi:hypothetical protein
VALSNVIDNAFKYSPGGPTVWVDGAWKMRVGSGSRSGPRDYTAGGAMLQFVRGSAAARG